MQKIPQLLFQFDQINNRCSPALKIRHLAVNAAPVTCIVGVEINSDGNSAGTARDDRINVGQPGTVAAVIILA